MTLLHGSSPMLDNPHDNLGERDRYIITRSLSSPTADSCTVSASLLTLLIAVPDILKYEFTLPDTLSTYLIYFVRVLSDFILIALWCAASVTMLLPKGKDFRLLFDRPPYVQWDCAVVLAVIEL